VERSLAAPNEKLKQKQKSARDLETKAAQEKNRYTTIRAVRTKSLDGTTAATQETSRREKSTNKMQVLIFLLQWNKILTPTEESRALSPLFNWKIKIIYDTLLI
jgi:hypothetical protein